MFASCLEKVCPHKSMGQELGDVLVIHDQRLAASVYYRAKVPEKTIQCMIRLGQSSKIVGYCKAEKYSPNWSYLLVRVHRLKRDDVMAFAKQLVEENYVSAEDVVNVLMGFGINDVEKTTEFLLDYLQKRGDREEDAALQTKILEINFRFAPQVAEAILASEDYELTKYDKQYIARLRRAAGTVNEDNFKNIRKQQHPECKECAELEMIKAEKQSLQSLVDELLKEQSENKGMKQQYEDELSALKQQLDIYRMSGLKESDETEKERKQRYEARMSALIAEHNEEKRALNAKMKEIEAKNTVLTEECKELTVSLEATKKELVSLKRRKSMNPKNFRKWTGDEVVDWIVSIEDGVFVKYEEKLRTAFKREGVNGEGLQFINNSLSM